MSKFYTLLTKIGEAQHANAQVMRTTVPWTHMALGDGGGEAVIPNRSQTGLVNEVYRVAINMIEVHPDNPNWIIVEAVVPSNVGGWVVRETAIIGGDSGDLTIAVGSYPEAYKPVLTDGAVREMILRMIVEITSAATVNMSIDPSVAIASRNYVDTTFAKRLLAPCDKGAVGDGIANDTTPIHKVVGSSKGLREYRVDQYSNTYGYAKVRDGLIHHHATGRVYNPLKHEHQLIFGAETLQYWFSKFKGDASKDKFARSDKKIVLSGDSTTYGFGNNPGYTPAELVAAYAKTRGYANVTVLNHGQSGHRTETWDSDFVFVDLDANPDLLILRWGANDGGVCTVEQYIDFLRSGLAKVRSAKSVAQLSIVLMTPSSMNDVTTGRSEVWSERINAGVREAARDFQCCFIDTYALFQNSHDGAGIWYDSIEYGGVGRAIHALDVLQQTIASVIADVVLPADRPMDVLNAFRVYSTFESVEFGNAAVSPRDALAGLMIHRTAKGSKEAPVIYGTDQGAPYNGTIVTLKGQEDTALQISIPLVYSNGELNGGTNARGISMRAGFDGEWSDWLGAWYGMNGYGANGWTVDANAYAQTSIEGRVFLNGLIYKNEGMTADETIIMTLPDSLRPMFDELFTVGGDIATQARLRIDTSGNVKVYNFTGGDYLTLGAISFKASRWARAPETN